MSRPTAPAEKRTPKPNKKFMKTGIELISEERQKQIDKHGFTAEHHVNHPEWYERLQLEDAAISILHPLINMHSEWFPHTPKNWDKECFENLCKRDRRERLIIAGALIAAELDRLELISELQNETKPYRARTRESLIIVDDIDDEN